MTDSVSTPLIDVEVANGTALSLTSCLTLGLSKVWLKLSNNSVVIAAVSCAACFVVVFIASLPKSSLTFLGKEYNLENLENFSTFMNEKLEKLEGDIDELKKFYLEIYSNPVKNKLSIK